jgi:glycosyltransferase involved in cell wall biosynthesis
MQYLVSWWKARQYERRIFRRFDLVTMVSEQDRRVSEAGLSNKRGRVEVVPNGVDCRHNRPSLAQPTPQTLVFNGSMTYDANLEAVKYFLDGVYPLVQSRVPGVSLTITGSTSGVDLSLLNLNGRVRLAGYVDDVRPLVAGASACVVPIRQGGGTRLKILEAMALGTPVVSTTKGAEGLEVTPGKNILIADEPADFASQVVRLMREPDLRERLAVNARRLVEERYDWRAIGQNFVRLVESVVEQRSLR